MTRCMRDRMPSRYQLQAPWRAVLWVALLGGVSGAGVHAQVVPPPQLPPTQVRPGGQAARPDTLTREGLEARQRALLERLARPPGADTTMLRQMDTATAAAQPAAPARPTRPDPSGDSLINRLNAELPGYQPTEYAGAQAFFDAPSRFLTLQGDSSSKVLVKYQDHQVTADSTIRYTRNGIVEALGRPEFTGPGQDPVTSRRLLVDTRTEAASAFGARTQYREGANWLVIGDLPRVLRDTVYALGTRFTSDEQRVPYYYFGASRVKIVRGKIMVAMPVRLYFGDVPVMWLPFVAQSLTRGRASGLLTPRFSLNDVVRSSTGYERRISNIGVYWAINDYLDATVAMDWFSNNYTALTTGLRFRHLRSFLGGTINARQFWRASGGKELSLTGQQSWEISERMNMNSQISYVTSTSFLRQNTFDPLEATQQIMSSGGITRRFDWGSLNVLGSRTQSLSDDRVDLSLPRATLSLKPITLFSAPTNRAAWYNNATWSGGASYARRSLDFPSQDTARVFAFHRADQGATQASANHSVSLRALSLGQDFRYNEDILRGIPSDTLSFVPFDADTVDVREATLDWSTSLSYQQTLVGQTSITPNISVSSTYLRSDTVELAQDFVSAPVRVSFGASLRSQLYGFFPGFGPFEAIRHRVSPGVSYNWSPAVEATELQQRVFGSRESRPISQLTFSFSQTFEAKRRVSESDTAAVAAAARDSVPALDPPPLTSTDTVLARPTPAGFEPLGPGNPTRPAQSPTVTLLSLTTSSISYDFVEADSAGGFIQGFTTTRLRNEIASDYLRDLSISVEHDLFRDSTFTFEPGGLIVREREFSPRLSAVNLRFSLSSRSNLLRWLGLGGGSGTDAEPELQRNPDPFGDDRSVTDEASILPGRRSQTEIQNQRATATQQRDWNASVSYALTRPRTTSLFGSSETGQNLRVALTTNPTRNWRMSWRTSYDLDRGEFNDHVVTLTRDLYRWQANFDFMKTATGNWSFRFEVSLIDASDLRFDYDQRSVIDSSRIPR
jgi:hypothetical protein